MTGALNTYVKLNQEQMYRKRQHMFRIRYTVFPLVLRFSGLPNERDIDSYVYWTVHHLDNSIKIDQLDVTRFIISLFTAQRVSNVSTSIFKSLRLTVDLFHVLYCTSVLQPA